MASFPPETLEFFRHHLFLPPGLPQQDDHNSDLDSALLQLVHEALEQFGGLVPEEQRPAVRYVASAISQLIDTRNANDGFVNEERLFEALNRMCEEDSPAVMPLHITAQNAGILFRKQSNGIQFEAFELSPCNRAAMSTQGRLQRCFPGPVLCIDKDELRQPDYLSTLAKALSKSSFQTAPGMMPTVQKSRNDIEEPRDTCHPGVVTELIVAHLQPISTVPTTQQRIWKNTREEVLWEDTLLPWRRSPLWLLLRTVMQLLFTQSQVARSIEPVTTTSRCLYKLFMVYLLAVVLSKSLAVNNPTKPDILLCMSAKISRRLLKLNPAEQDPGIAFIQATLQRTRHYLEQKWTRIQALDDRRLDLDRLRALNFENDVSLSLPELDDFISSISERSPENNSLGFSPSSDLLKLSASSLPTNDIFASSPYITYKLTAFEHWVASDLPAWLAGNLGNSGTCAALKAIMEGYHTAAQTSYSDNPEANSIMILTLIELWIACDKSAVSLFPMLRDYDAGVQLEPLQSLILPSKEQLVRLRNVETYLESRRAAVCLGDQGSIFRDYGTPNCFSVRFYNASQKHKDLRHQIEADANEERRQKCLELLQKQNQYNSLMQRYNDRRCEFDYVVSPWGGSYNQHAIGCSRCELHDEAESITIDVHEWPLPSEELRAESVVFELHAPQSFCAWRDATAFAILDVFGATYHDATQSLSGYYSLETYEALQSYFRGKRTRRIGLLSENKPHVVTHRKERFSVSAITEGSVCLNNGLNFHYYDHSRSCFVGQFAHSDLVPLMCTYQTASTLQPFLLRTFRGKDSMPNEVISSQWKCPQNLSYAEYRALAGLTVGYRLQWMNILSQLRSPAVDFKKPLTSLVVLQAIYQAGPQDNEDFCRASHSILATEVFPGILLSAVDEAIGRIEKNWESYEGLGIFTCIVARQLTLSTRPYTTAVALNALVKLRNRGFSWLKLLRRKRDSTEDEAQRREFAEKIVVIALICSGTFNVDEQHLESILGDTKQASILIQCGIMINELYSDSQKPRYPLLSIHYRRWQRLSYRTYPLLARTVTGIDATTCLDIAVKVCWPEYRRMGRWETTTRQTDEWVVSNTDSQSGQSLRVHFNLLTGQLLVNGLPLSRLPDSYEQHNSYRELFGGIVLEIMPSSVAGFQFSAKQRYSGYSLQFGLDDPDMLVRASKDDHAFDLIPKRVFQGKLPHTFSEDFVHWCDRAAGSVEFRSSRQPWESVVNPWKLVRDGSGWKLSKRQFTLVNPTSPTGDKLAGILAPLQSRLQINITLAEIGQSLEVELPRLKLAFNLEKGGSALKSRQFRGLEIDSNQSIGTLTGLKNKLVLRDPLKGDRRVIVPAGNVLFVRDGDHVSVGMNPSTTSTHVYRLDTTLGLLRDNGSLQSKIFLSYLHAVTSFCLPDTLTHCTGTEQALSILKSAAVNSVPFLTAENMDLLQKVEALTPRRNYYPEHERVMQTIQWNPQLPILAQNSQFHQCVMELWNQNKLSKIYYPKDHVTAPEPAEIHPNMHNFSTLIQRDNVRSSTFHISGFGAEEFTDVLDVTYDSRDLGQSSERSKRAGLAAAMAFHRQPRLQYQLSCFQGLKSHFLDVLKTVGTVRGPDSLESSDSTLEYDGRWLQNHPEHWAKLWCWLHRDSLPAPSHKITKAQFMLWLTTMAFSSEADMDIIQVAALMFSLPQIQAIRPPSISHFRLNEGDSIDASVLEPLIRPAHLSIYQCPEARLEMRSYESYDQWEGRKQTLYRSNLTQATEWLANCLASDWPCREPTSRWQRIGTASNYINIDQAADAVNAKFKSCYENMLFSQYLELLEFVIGDQSIHPLEVVDLHYEIPQYTSVRRKTFISPEDLFASSLSGSLPKAPRLSETAQRVSSARSHLESLIQACESKAGSLYEMKYVMELKDSLGSLGSDKPAELLDLEPEELRHELEGHLHDSVKHVDLLFETMSVAMCDGLRSRFPTSTFSPAPRTSPVLMLRQLSHGHWDSLDGWPSLPAAWKPWIVAYALALTGKQRAQRLVSSLHNRNDLERELKNEGHANWDPMKYPDSLLLEVESDIMIREVQEHIAAKMRQPDGHNAVMQLNMGEGKSTVIAPAVTAALADGSRLVRVVVAKPQSRQMFHMLVSKLGGLLNRKIFHLPFSRTLRLNILDAQVIYDECKRCIAVGGVMLVQPEQLLSLKLMGLESLIESVDSPGKGEIGRSLLQTQHLFDTKSRDIVDESDENFSVKFELIYTMGQQGPIEFAPERWMVIQTVLQVIREHVKGVRDVLPASIEIQEGPTGSFPRFRLLKGDATEMLLDQVARGICNNGFPGFPISRQDASSRESVLKYINQQELSLAEAEEVEKGEFWSETTRPYLLLLRGLFAQGVLAFAFGHKRWRVNYGLDNTRQPPTKLAVPFRAKDFPTPRSEFSHPDVVILLTCCCYYYGGLSDDDLTTAFGHLLESDQADAEYQEWIADSNHLPGAFRQLMGVNMKDTFQCKTEVFPSFRYAKRAIDYFLEFIVFPKQMKEFPQKLSTSGWDIGAVKTHPTTGFSGTIDSRAVLPIDVSYLALEEQKFTNAHVLKTLLRSDNDLILLGPTLKNADGLNHDLSHRGSLQQPMSEAETLLSVVVGQKEPPVRVILDVGAQILEMSNAQVATRWLEMSHAQDPTIQGAIFFDENEELMVVDIHGYTECLRTSPYGEQLDVCLVFLDEAHTRGTDLKLPQDYRAAVTLGASLTKDRLAQACMRMRRLGQGQSVVFCVPREIQTIIRERILPEGETKTRTESIKIRDLLVWAISETHIDIRKSMPLWAAQGERFEHQRLLWDEARTDTGIEMTAEQAAKFLEVEAQTLEQRYRPEPVFGPRTDREATTDRLRQIQARCDDVGSTHANEATLQEEQERELSPEIEQERQLERPPPAIAALHSIHEDLRNFVSSGIIPRNSSAFVPAFETLRKTSANNYLDVGMFPKDILVTVDFAETVEAVFSPGGGGVLDAYQRPIQWVLSSQPHSWRHVVIISPHEAQELLPAIQSSGKTTLHIYAPRPNLEIRPLDSLDLYTVPSSAMEAMTSIPIQLKTQLNFFAGQLYFDDFSEYTTFCDMLRLSWRETSEGIMVAPDGFIVSWPPRTSDDTDGSAASAPAQASTFTESPVKASKAFLMMARRDCQPIEKTHVGRALDGALLRKTDFEIPDETA